MDVDGAPEPARALVVVHGVALAGPLADLVADRAGGPGARATVVVPAIPSSRPSDWLTEAADPKEAEHAMRGAVGALRSRGIDAVGRLGDANPLGAIDDAIVALDPGTILLVTGPGVGAADAERALWRARRRVLVPVVHIDAAREGIEETLRLLCPCPDATADRIAAGAPFGAIPASEDGVLLVDRPIEPLIVDHSLGMVALEVPAALARRHEIERGDFRERRFRIPAAELDRSSRVVGSYL